MNTKGKVGKIRVKISNIGIYLFLFLSYHVSSLGFLGINSGLQILIALLIVVLISFRHYSHLKRTKAIPALWFVVFAISLRNNWYLQEAKISYVFYFFVGIMVLFILQHTDQWIPAFRNALFFFSYEHLILSWIFYVLRPWYISLIIPLFESETQHYLIKWSKQNVLMGLTSHYTTSGVYFAFAWMAFFCWWLIDMEDKKRFIMMAIMFFSLILTQKRGPMLFAAAGIVVIFFIYKKFNIKTILRFFGILILIVTAVSILSNYVSGISSFINRFMNDSGEDITSGRISLYLLAIQLFLRNPILGIGWGQYKAAYERYLWRGTSIYENLSAHNIYLQLLAETGVAGALLVITLLFCALVKSIRLLKVYVNEKNMPETELFAILFSVAMQVYFILYGMTGNPLYDRQCYFPYFLSVAVIYALNGKIHRKVENR